MTTATSNHASRVDAPRRRPGETAGHSRTRGASADDCPVLIRLPNLESRRTTPPPSPQTPAEETKFAEPETKTVKLAEHTTESVVAPNSLPMWAAKPATWVSPQVMNWIWKLVILGAAIGLVVLAYKIINGSGEAVAPPDANVADSADEFSNEPTELGNVEVTPLEPIEPVPQGFANPAPPTDYDPYTTRAHEHRQTNAGRDSGSLAPDENTLPIGPGQQHPTTRENEPPRAAPNAGSQTRPWNGPSADQGGTAHRWDQSAEQYPRVGSADRFGGARHDGAANVYQSTAEPSDYPQTQYPQSGYPQTNGYDYPETNSSTWRNQEGGSAAPQSNPAGQGAAQYPNDWMEGSQSAARPSRPGVARLRGEIEQPPLR